MATPPRNIRARSWRSELFVALVVVPVVVLAMMYDTPFGGWAQSLVTGTGVRWQDAYVALEMPESNLPRDERERERLLLAWAHTGSPPPKGMPLGPRLHRAGTLARLRYETFDHVGAPIDTWEVRALVPNIGNGVGPFWREPCGRSCREERSHSTGMILARSGEPGIAEEWVLRMPVGQPFDLETQPLRTRDILDTRDRVVGIGTIRVGSDSAQNPARIRITLVNACHGTVRVGTTMNLQFESRLPIPRGFETSSWAQLDGCGKLEPLPPPPAPVRIVAMAAEPVDLHAIVVHRTAGTGRAALRVDEAWLGRHRLAVVFGVDKVCRYDPADETWHELPRPDARRSWRIAPLGSRQGSMATRIAYETPPDIGLYWVRWSEQDDGNRSANRVQWRDAHLFSGPVLCNDVMLGPAPPEKVAMCVPFANRAEARFVPEAASTCAP